MLVKLQQENFRFITECQKKMETVFFTNIALATTITSLPLREGLVLV
jgi:hypothetical protein